MKQNQDLNIDQKINTKDPQFYKFSIDFEYMKISVGSHGSGKNIAIYLDQKKDIQGVSAEIIKDISGKENKTLDGNGNLLVVGARDGMSILDHDAINKKLHEILKEYNEAVRSIL